MSETKLLQRITINPTIFGDKPIVRSRRLAVEHVLGMLAAGDTTHCWSCSMKVLLDTCVSSNA